MTYQEWKECFDFAEMKAQEVKDFNIRVKPYTLYNGTRGLELQLWDEDWSSHWCSLFTGVWNDVEQMKDSITTMIGRLVLEAKR